MDEIRDAAAFRERVAAEHARRDPGRYPDQDRENAARYAGWMLAEGRAEEAFLALETAAALRLGHHQPVPSAPEVAAALRATGAAALLYLHPTDDAARSAGVLRLDPLTDRLEVLANIPVTDPLTSDDPGWPAVFAAVSTGLATGLATGPPHLVIAATGPLARLALPAIRTDTGRYLAEEVSLTHVPSGTELIALDGHSGVLGWLWPVPAPAAGLALFLTRLIFAEQGLSPAATVSAVQRWFLDPDRTLPPSLPAPHRHTATTTDLTRPDLWAALACHGR
ncbi:hypothetical protein [Actinoplanes sp. NPDC051851]|uniref:hypothetical protein n=1 Tax=Actinoplanes sp. NPDC051851 TaxID=3154753 RepID=UPI00343D3B55